MSIISFAFFLVSSIFFQAYTHTHKWILNAYLLFFLFKKRYSISEKFNVFLGFLSWTSLIRKGTYDLPTIVACVLIVIIISLGIIFLLFVVGGFVYIICLILLRNG